MGFIEKAKNTLGKGFGDETVKIVDYEADFEERPTVEKPKRKPKPIPKRNRPERKPKERKPKPAPKPKVKEEEPVEDKWSFNLFKKNKDEIDNTEKNINEIQEEENLPEFNPIIEDIDENDDEGSIFAVDMSDEFFNQKQEEYETELNERFGDMPDLELDSNQLKDILDLLGIPATFEIEKNIYLPEDIDEIEFDLQAPYGFEQGQVKAFKDKSKNSIMRYVELLKLRNAHVAKLATAIDRLQVDNNNLRYQNEISAGINIMPTTDSEELENKILEERLRNRRLEDEIKVLRKGDNLTSTERKKYDELQDHYSISLREKAALEDENLNLKARIAQLEEELDDYQEGSNFNETSLPSEPELPAFNELPSNLPDELPEPDISKPVTGESKRKTTSSVFDLDSSIELVDDSYNTTDASPFYDPPAESSNDDELDKLLREWNS